MDQCWQKYSSTLNYIYFFSNEHIKSISKYIPKRLHKAVIRDFTNTYDNDDQLDGNASSWYHKAANVSLTKSFIVIIIILTHYTQIQLDQDNRYMAIQAIAIESIFLNKAISTQIY